MLGSPPRSKIAPQTPEWFAGNPPQPKSTGWGRVSQGDTQLPAFFLPSHSSFELLVQEEVSDLPNEVLSPGQVEVPWRDGRLGETGRIRSSVSSGQPYRLGCLR